MSDLKQMIDEMTALNNDMVHHPNHYRHGGFECEDIIDALLMDADLDPVTSWRYACTFKYLFRWPFKGKDPEQCVQDLDKAIECAERVKESYIANIANKESRHE